jgi:dTDP-4-dehydrorhamnose reductase
MKKIFVVGPHGKVGSELVRQGAEPVDIDVMEDDKSIRDALPPMPTLSSCDDLDEIVVVYCAGVSVNECEADARLAFNVHVRGAINVADAMNGWGTLVYLSSDHVFNGDRRDRYEHHAPDPINQYGLSKMIGEKALGNMVQTPCVVVRTSRLFDDNYTTSLHTVMMSESKFDSPTFLYRSFLHIKHFASQLLGVLSQEEIPYHKMRNGERVLHLAGKDTLNFYQFNAGLLDVMGVSQYRRLIEPRDAELPDRYSTPRPHRLGLKSKVLQFKYGAFDL